jgi:HD superfamily phosphodiesterase
LARHAYAQLLTAARGWYSVATIPTGPDAAHPESASDIAARRLQHTKRAVQRVIDLMHEDDACIVGLACTGAGGRDVGAHAARVCVLALAVARQAGHARGQLQTVALAALLHDVGVAGPVPALEHNSSAPAALRGAARLLETLPADTAAPAALAALASEQGTRAAAMAPSALARLIRIADLYDQLIQRTASQTSQAAARPDAVVHFVFQHGAQAIDAALAQRFAAVLGVFPPGSVVRLDSGETAVVVRANHASVDRPQVLLVRDASGARLDGSACVDLAVRRSGDVPDPAIATSLDPAEAGIDPLEWFLTEPVQRQFSES